MIIPTTVDDLKGKDTLQLREISNHLRSAIELVENEIKKIDRVYSTKSRIEYLEKITDPSKITCSYMKLLWYIQEEIKNRNKRQLSFDDVRGIIMMKPISFSEGTLFGEILSEMERMNYITIGRLGEYVKVVTK